MRLERTREDMFTLTATGDDLLTLVAGARIGVDALRAAPDPSSAGALDGLERVLAAFDRARARLEGEQSPAG